MKPLELNLSRRPYRNDTPIATALIVALVVTLGFTSYNVYTWLTADAQLSRLAQELRDHDKRMFEIDNERKRLQKELDKVELDVLEPQAEFVAAVLQERNFSWTLFFEALEKDLPWNIRLQTVRPSFQAGRVTIAITAEARDQNAFYDFQEKLQNSPFFDQVLPGGWERGRGADQRVAFTMNFQYLPEVHEQLAAAVQVAEEEGEAPETIVVEGEDEPVVEAASTASELPPEPAPEERPAPPKTRANTSSGDSPQKVFRARGRRGGSSGSGSQQKQQEQGQRKDGTEAPLRGGGVGAPAGAAPAAPGNQPGGAPAGPASNESMAKFREKAEAGTVERAEDGRMKLLTNKDRPDMTPEQWRELQRKQAEAKKQAGENKGEGGKK